MQTNIPTKRIGYCFYHTLANIILLDVQGDTPLGKVIAFYLAHVLTLFGSKKRQMHLWNDGKTTILIYYSDKGIYASCLINTLAFGACFAK